MKSTICDRTLCTGCSACFSACKAKAIQMVPNEEGFFYPDINEDICVHCGKCKKVCPVHNTLLENNQAAYYAVKNKSTGQRMRSSSGGVFALLASEIESRHGTVYGAAFDEQFEVHHMRADTQEKWKTFCTSKYVQSNVGNTFLQVQQDLQAGMWVLFSGTPCQVEGLKLFLEGKSTEKLILCDIVCHGVPSPAVWKSWLQYLNKQTHCKISKVNFRDKSQYGWHDSRLLVEGVHERTIANESQQKGAYFQLFFQGIILRPSCHKCQFANIIRTGDISLGDFWGIEKFYPDFDDDKGISLVFCNTSKGKELWKQVSHNADYIKVRQDECYQPNLKQPSAVSPDRHKFWEIYNKHGLERAMKEFGLIRRTAVERAYRKMKREFKKLF